jgi:hypothetical protein
MGRDLLGPAREPGPAPRERLLGELALAAAGYAILAAAYWLTARTGQSSPGSGGTIPSPAAQRSSS